MDSFEAYLNWRLKVNDGGRFHFVEFVTKEIA
jgi:hypothetical protein